MEADIPRDLLMQLLRDTFGTKVELVDCQVGKRQHDYLVLLLQLDHPAVGVVVKLAGPESQMASSFDRTAMLHRLVAAQTAIPMPDVIAVDTTCQTWPWRYFIRTHTPGLEWATVQPEMDRDVLSDAYRQIGNAVAELHSIRFPAFGELSADGSVQGPGSYLGALTEHARRIIRDARLQELFGSVLDRERDLFADVGQADLCHEDLHKYNILFEHRQGRWHLATILDFDKAWAGHHETDLARLELWTGMTSREFWQAYEGICSVDPLYSQRRPIYQLLWCFEYARSTPQHLADTRRLCKELGLTPFEGFD